MPRLQGTTVNGHILHLGLPAFSVEFPKNPSCIYATPAQPFAVPSKFCSAAVNGIDAYPVEVEVNSGYGDTLIVMIS